MSDFYGLLKKGINFSEQTLAIKIRIISFNVHFTTKKKIVCQYHKM